jgi:hypothetical protein
MTPTARSEKWSAFDVVKSMLAILALENKESIPTSKPILHKALHSLCKNSTYASFFKEYLFDTRSFPYSKDFQADLLNLEQAGHLSSQNPDFEMYTFKPKLKKNFELKAKTIFEENDLKTIKKMAIDFYSEIQKVSK